MSATPVDTERLRERVDNMLGHYQRRQTTNVPGTISLIRDLALLLDEVVRLRAERAIDRPPTHWGHRPGDTYVVIRPYAWGNERSGFRIVYDRLSEPFTTAAEPWEYGIGLGYADDVNLAVYRDGQMVATLWVDPEDPDPEIADSDPAVVAGIARAIEFDRGPVPEPAPAEHKVVDLMAALEQSVNDAKAARRRKPDEATPENGEGGQS